MPNYSIVANTTFRNRSFEDLLKPLAMYTAEYNSIQDAVGELDTKASVWEGMANKEQDPVAYAQFKRYSDELKEQANLMATQGLTPKSRISLQNLKSRYASEIIPIEQAYTNRKMQADEQRKALLQNPTLLLSRRADATSLDEYLKNPQLGYDSYSGALLTQQVGTAAATLAKSLRDYGRGKPLDAFTSTWLKQHGYTAAEVAQAINYPDHPSSNKILTSLVNNVIADSGIPQWADRPTLQQAYNYANQGLWQAVGQTDVTPFENYGARLAAQEASQKRVAAYQHALANQPPAGAQGLPGETVRLNFNDPTSAGNAMKARMADATVEFMKKNANNPYVKNIKAYWDKHGGWDAAKKHWTTNGFNGSEKWTGKSKGGNGIYYKLGNYLRENVTMNEGLINIWRSGFGSPYAGSSNTPHSSSVVAGQDMPTLSIWPKTIEEKRPQIQKKNWGNFDLLSSNGYYVNAIQLNDKRGALDAYLARTLSRLGRDGKVKLYDIKSIDANNNYTYSAKAMKYKDLPLKSDGTIDYSRINRSMLSNGDYMLYWQDNDGNTVQKVLKRSDIGDQAVRDWQRTDPAYKAAVSYYADGKITADQFATIARQLGITNMANAYLDTQEVEVQDYKLE